MERSNFINLLEQYKQKALVELQNETKVHASLLLTDEFKSAVVELENRSKIVNSGLGEVRKAVKRLSDENGMIERNEYLYLNESTEAILDKVIYCISARLQNTGAYAAQKAEIKSKFDAAISAAKATRSPAKLKDLADALGIETPSIEVNNKITATLDTEYVKEKIKAVSLLQEKAGAI